MQRIIEVRVDAKAFRIGRRPHDVDGFVEHLREIDERHLQPQLAGDDARDVEEVFDSPRLRGTLRSGS